MPTFTKKPLTAMVVMLTLLPGTAALANEFSLSGNQINVDGVGNVALASNGAFENISTVINNPVPASIPDIDFTLVNNNTTDGVYDLRLGLVIQQQGTNNRLESVLGVIRVTVSGGGTITSVSLPNSEDVDVTVRRGSATLNYNGGTNAGIITTAGANVTVSASAISQQLIGDNPVFADMVDALAEAGHYNYRVTLQPVDGDARIGTTNGGSFAPLARMQTSCSLDAASTSAFTFNLDYADRFPAAYAAHGVISLGGATSPSSGFSPITEACDEVIPPDDVPPIPEVDQDISQAQDAIDRAQQAIADGDQEAVAEEIDNALDSIEDALALLNQQATSEGEANQTQLLTLIQTIDQLAEIAEEAQEELDLDLPDETLQINAAIVNVLELLADSDQDLNSSDLGIIEDAITQVLAANGHNDDDALDQAKRQLDDILILQGELGVSLSGEQAAEQRRLNGVLNPSVGITPEELREFLQGLLVNPAVGYANFTQFMSPSIIGDFFGAYRVDENMPVIQTALTIPDQPGAIQEPDGIITARAEDGRAFRYIFTGAAFIPDGVLENGLYNAPNGALYSVRDGVMIEFASAPANLPALQSSLSGMGFSGTIEGPGILNVTLDNGDHVSAAFRFEDIADSTGDCTSITFIAPTGHPTSENYLYFAECNNGIRQALVPVVLEQALYRTLAYSDLGLRNSRDTGYLQVDGVGVFRPDYFVQPLSLEQRFYFNANKNAEGIALQAGDFDGNGKTDYRVLSERGAQILWGL